MESETRQVEVDIDGWYGVFVGEACFAVFPNEDYARDWCRGKLGERHMAVLEIRRADKKFDTGAEQS